MRETSSRGTARSSLEKFVFFFFPSSARLENTQYTHTLRTNSARFSTKKKVGTATQTAVAARTNLNLWPDEFE